MPNLPEDQYSADRQAIARKRALAQALQQQALQQPGTQQIGGIAIRNSPLSGIAPLVQALMAKKGMGEADTQDQALTGQIQQRRGADMSLLANALGGRQASPGGLQEDASGNVTPMDPVKALSPVQSLQQAIPMIQDPQLQQFGLQAQQGAVQRQDQQAFNAEQKEADRVARTQDRILALQTAEANAAGNRELQATLSRERMDLQKTIADAANQTRRDVAQVTADASAQRVADKAAEKRDVAFNQDQAMLSNMEGAMDRLSTAANEVLVHPGLGGITGIRGKIPNIPGTEAANAAAKLQTLKAQTGFGILQEMRNASKTGGALGSVTEKELGFLQNALAALDTAQSIEQFQESLQKIKDYAAGAKARIRSAVSSRHGDRLQPTPAPAGGDGWKIVPVSGG